MSMRTVTLITLIGIIVHFALSLFSMLLQFVSAHAHIPPELYQLIWFLNTIILNCALIFFLIVFYSKKKE